MHPLSVSYRIVLNGSHLLPSLVHTLHFMAVAVDFVASKCAGFRYYDQWGIGSATQQAFRYLAWVTGLGLPSKC
ncbi:hypothetical protein EJ110_NYTH37374 [Nymphaea thermarum]|nr:hypothetical protein EJ110_NYTH37374 [Nymphaea thermarum]